MKAFETQICTTIEQSKRLLDLGLKPETADMYYFWLGGNDYCLKVDDNNPLKYNMDKTYIPCWSLHKLLCMLDYDNADTFNIMPNLAYEDVIATISLRIDCGAFNKEYLKQ